MTTLTLEFPPSANRYWRRGQNGTYVSKEAQDYKESVGWKCREIGTSPLSGKVRITVQAYMPAANRDLSNTAKVLEDALQGHLYIDDLQIVEQHYYRHEASKPKRKNARVVVTVEQL
jgi:crossover junction endodeoxyribonuclease RusA